MDVTQPAASFLQIRFEQEGDLTVTPGPIGDHVREFGQSTGGTGPPSAADALEQGGGQGVVPGNHAGVQQTERRLQVTVRDSDGLRDGSDAVVETDSGVPERVPDGVGQLGDVVPPAVVDEQQIEVAAESGFAAPVAADRDQRDACSRVAEQVAQHAVGHVHQRTAKGRPDGCVELAGPAQQRGNPVGHRGGSMILQSV